MSVVAPVYRNADTVGELYRRVDAAVGERLRELVLIDDACPEGSGAVVAELAAADRRVQALTLERNVGQHAAILAGLRRAGGEWTVVLDADLQDPPEAIPTLLERAARGDVAAVFAGRRGRYQSKGRLLTSRAYKRLQALLAGVPGDAGTFVALHRSLVDELIALRGPSPSLVAMIGCLGRPMASVPIERAVRAEGSSSYSHAARLVSASRALRWIVWWRLGRAHR